MNDEWYEEPDDLAAFSNYPANQVDETLETFEINGEVVSDRLKQLFQKAAQKKSEKRTEEDIVEDLGSALKAFIVDMVKVMDYRDLSVLLEMKPENLKNALGNLGIKVPVESAKKWEDINVGVYQDVSYCSRCQVQLNHHTFLVGIGNCRKCYEENIKHWVKTGESINLYFKD